MTKVKQELENLRRDTELLERLLEQTAADADEQFINAALAEERTDGRAGNEIPQPNVGDADLSTSRDPSDIPNVEPPFGGRAIRIDARDRARQPDEALIEVVLHECRTFVTPSGVVRFYDDGSKIYVLLPWSDKATLIKIGGRYWVLCRSQNWPMLHEVWGLDRIEAFRAFEACPPVQTDVGNDDPAIGWV